MFVRFGVSVGVVAVAAALVSGCSGSDDRPSAPASSVGSSATASTPVPSRTQVSPSPSPTGPATTGPNMRPGEKPPVVVPDLRRDTPSGALALGFYFYAALDWGYATNDPWLLQQISLKSCKACRSAIEGIESVRSNRGKITGGRLAVSEAHLDSHHYAIAADWAVDVTLMEQAVIVTLPSQKPSVAAPAVKAYKARVFARWTGAQWKVVEVESQ